MFNRSLLPPTSGSKRPKNNLKMEAGRSCETSVIIYQSKPRHILGIFYTANRISNLATESVLTFQMQSIHVTIIIKRQVNSHTLCELRVILLLSITGILPVTMHSLFISYRYIIRNRRQTIFSMKALWSCVKTLRLVANEEMNLKLCTNSIQITVLQKSGERSLFEFRSLQTITE